ncbi:hypothetical protein AWV79_24585 [Cupriavidus sp. UYMMa02A]|nr:hypothetical protein AWV79_24585 [Cupriavidus sp. UYMMa02A]
MTPGQVAADASCIDALIHPADVAAYRASFEASAAQLAPWHLEYRVQLPMQGLRWRQGDARPQRLPDGSIVWHGFITDVTERKRIEAELQELATIDSLTGLPNRRHFLAQIDTRLASLQGGRGSGHALLMCDLDHFKSINDRWGHGVGDRALRHFGSILRASCGPGICRAPWRRGVRDPRRCRGYTWRNRRRAAYPGMYCRIPADRARAAHRTDRQHRHHARDGGGCKRGSPFVAQ